MVNEEIIRAELAAQFLNVVAYRGSDLYAAFVSLLDKIEDCYAQEMLTVSPEKLLTKQGAAAQVRVLRNLLINCPADSVTDLPKV